MYNCIFSAHCTEAFCDKSCPMLVETSYLMERNGITMQSPVFAISDVQVNRMLTILSLSESNPRHFGVYRISADESTIQIADILTYCAICKNWKGSRLHCNVYNLKYSKYIDEMKKSWSGTPESETFQYMKIWSETAKVLIISNFDYVNFGDFESQTMLNLIQQRESQGLTTIMVTPQIGTLVSGKKSTFFDILCKMMKDNIIKPEGGGNA